MGPGRATPVHAHPGQDGEVGSGLQGIAEGLDRLARSSVWNMQRRTGFQVTVRYQDRNARTAARGLDTQLILARPALEENPRDVIPSGCHWHRKV